MKFIRQNLLPYITFIYDKKKKKKKQDVTQIAN